MSSYDQLCQNKYIIRRINFDVSFSIISAFGAGAYYGMKFEIGAKVLEMKAICGVEPYGGVTVYGELGIGFALYGKLRLEGRIMDLRFPTTAEISFNKFPLDVG